MSIEAMKMALEALDSCDWDYDYDENPHKTFDEKLVNDAAEALRQAIEEAEFDRAFDEYAESDKGKSRIKAVFKQSFEQSIDKLIEHIKTRQQEAK